MSFSVTSADFWIALREIFGINILLSGDNAVVIALAARTLPPHQQKQAILYGSGAAVVLRVILTVVAVQLLALSYLQIVGGLLLIWIGVQLLGDEDEHEEGQAQQSNLMTAVRTILIADLVMSLDNVVAVAAAAEKGPPGTTFLLLVLGLGLSIPFIVFGSTLLVSVMARFPIIVTLGAALLGYLAGDMLVTDPVDAAWFAYSVPYADVVVGCAGALLVVAVGWWLSRRTLRQA